MVAVSYTESDAMAGRVAKPLAMPRQNAEFPRQSRDSRQHVSLDTLVITGGRGKNGHVARGHG